ncbi:hypothetical protein L3Q82_002243 [Scortum barcoo]|uniref:Uncharacterized protein n=1 Tax=Scortum barcoo TaxID=214431 RepID=A0ACB8VXP7_9TELE|nr:hypothetical protein L3Q82_002243 [Scortum barcoo]
MVFRKFPLSNRIQTAQPATVRPRSCNRVQSCCVSLSSRMNVPLSLWLALLMSSCCGNAGSDEEESTTEYYDYVTETPTPDYDYDYNATFDYYFFTGQYEPELRNKEVSTLRSKLSEKPVHVVQAVGLAGQKHRSDEPGAPAGIGCPSDLEVMGADPTTRCRQLSVQTAPGPGHVVLQLLVQSALGQRHVLVQLSVQLLPGGYSFSLATPPASRGPTPLQVQPSSSCRRNRDVTMFAGFIYTHR